MVSSSSSSWEEQSSPDGPLYHLISLQVYSSCGLIQQQQLGGIEQSSPDGPLYQLINLQVYNSCGLIQQQQLGGAKLT